MSRTASCGTDGKWHLIWTIRNDDGQSITPTLRVSNPDVAVPFTPTSVDPTGSASASKALPSGWSGVISATITFTGDTPGPPTTTSLALGACVPPTTSTTPPPTAPPPTVAPTTAPPPPEATTTVATAPPGDPRSATAFPADTILVAPAAADGLPAPSDPVPTDASGDTIPSATGVGTGDLASDRFETAAPTGSGGSSGPGAGAIAFAVVASTAIIAGAGLAVRWVLHEAAAVPGAPTPTGPEPDPKRS
jgi:hypothetical protein